MFPEICEKESMGSSLLAGRRSDPEERKSRHTVYISDRSSSVCQYRTPCMASSTTCYRVLELCGDWYKLDNKPCGLQRRSWSAAWLCLFINSGPLGSCYYIPRSWWLVSKVPILRILFNLLDDKFRTRLQRGLTVRVRMGGPMRSCALFSIRRSLACLVRGGLVRYLPHRLSFEADQLIINQQQAIDNSTTTLLNNRRVRYVPESSRGAIGQMLFPPPSPFVQRDLSLPATTAGIWARPCWSGVLHYQYTAVCTPVNIFELHMCFSWHSYSPDPKVQGGYLDQRVASVINPIPFLLDFFAVNSFTYLSSRLVERIWKDNVHDASAVAIGGTKLHS